jgi:hypothetical protein
MKTFITKSELGLLTGLDPRTAIKRYRIQAAGILLAGKRETVLYSLDAIMRRNTLPSQLIAVF